VWFRHIQGMPALPSARVVRQAGAPVAPPPVPLRIRLSPVIEPLRLTFGYLLAFWPLTVCLLMAAGLVWAAGYHAGP
jgi:hypothetical protein